MTLTPQEIVADIESAHAPMPVPDIVYGVHISLQHRYLYAITPKAACSTLRVALLRLELGHNTPTPPMSVIHAREYHPTLSPLQVGSFSAFLRRDDIFKFCFVRDPYTRLLSSYLDRIGRNKAEKRRLLDQLGLAGDPIETPVSFGGFVRHVTRQSVAEQDPHWRVQYHQTLQGSIRYDFIGRYERFAEDTRVVAERLHPDFLSYLPDALNVTGADRQMDDYYTPELLGLVSEAFALDFEAFGYPKR